jgi:hypothetical protein
MKGKSAGPTAADAIHSGQVETPLRAVGGRAPRHPAPVSSATSQQPLLPAAMVAAALPVLIAPHRAGGQGR